MIRTCDSCLKDSAYCIDCPIYKKRTIINKIKKNREKKNDKY